MAQNPFCINYSTNDGLPSANIYSIYQDEKGFLWFTTDAGIVKYDSHTFSLFNTDNGLSDNEVFQMKRDHKGRVWLLTLNGKTSYIFHDKIYNESNSALVKRISGSSLMSDFYEDAQKNIYFLYRDGEIAIVKPNDQVIKKSKAKIPHIGVWKNKDKLSFLTPLGIYSEDSNLLIHNNLASNHNRTYHFQNENYLSHDNELFRVGINNQLEKIVAIPEKTEILQMYIEKNKIWICTRNGLYLKEKQGLKRYFENEIVSNVTRDFEGGYWISTLKNGVYYVPSFEVFINNMNASTPTKLNCISINDKKEIWIGGEYNTYFVKSANQDFVKETFPSGNQTDEVKSIRFFNGNTYIIGKTMITEIDNHHKKTAFGFGGNDILIDEQDCFIGYNLTFKMSLKKIDQIIKSKKATLNVLLSKRTSVFSKDSKNNIWIGTNTGLYQYNRKDSITNWSTKSNNLQSSIQDLYFDDATKTLLVASNSKGIITVKNNQVIDQISKKNGLNSITCNTIKKIADDYYLVGSNNGLNSIAFKNKTYTIKNLNAILGLKNKRINDIDYLDDIVYLATDNGLLYFNIKNIERKNSQPKCLIESLKNQSGIVPQQQQYQFNYNNNDLSINYTGISYINQNNLSYYYKLDGQNDKWSATNESQINYKSLAPKKYTFCVYCMDGYGVKSNTATISFEILAPFWQKTWFILLCILLISLLIYAFIKYQLKQQQQLFEIERASIQFERDKANLEKQMIDLEQKALRLQMNPHFIFNALNTIKGYYSEGDAVNASTYISKFSKLLRMLLENTDQVISLANEIEMLQLYIELTKIRYKNKFEYELFVDDHLNSNDIAIPTLLLQPIVENAIIHGLAPKNEMGLLKISFLKNENQLECHVEDNGIGRDASKKNQKHKEYQSKALEITTERIALFSKDIGKSTFEIIDLISDGKSTGTKVIVTIPLINIW